jgi:ABC-type multidrug transport system ATPase subunit/pSer/pThr/pTyr-binding forkhead associated (FHA) protein
LLENLAIVIINASSQQVAQERGMDVVNRPPSLASIQFLTGPLAGNSIQIRKTTVTIGREPGNDVVISDPTVSRQHARLVYNGSQWSIEKLNPHNTLAVNRREVQQAVINDRDTISVGPGTSFLFISSAGMKRSVTPPPTPSQQVPFPSPQQPFNAQPWPQQPPQGAASSPAPMPTVAASPPRPGQPGGGTKASLFTAGNEVSSGTADIRGVPSLEISSNVHRDKHAYPLTKQVINIGRDPSNDIVINELVVSGFHAQIVREGSQFVFLHPHPTRQSTLNGLLYQGQHIQGSEPFRKPLARGDIFRIGDEHGTLVTLTFNDGSGAPQDIAPEIRPIPLGAAVITIGRLPSNTVVLNHPQVSGQHARLEQVQGGYRIIDMGSTNHVYVNAQRVTNQLLKPGDEVRIGPFKLTYTGTQLTQHDESNSIRIDALHLKKVGNKQTILISDISVAVPPRKFVALVGGSGAGKSTLMDALNGLRPAQQGAVLYNGQDYYRHLAAFSTQLGYVPQDDIIHRDLTVERALYYAAKMRLPEDFTAKQVKQRIDEVLDDVEMKYRRNLLVSKLSGGQRKRVSIALELLANPSVFFLDEPTSGLDPGLDRKMMFLLRKLADKGHTIVLVTHATNNINACDYVCFLCQGGRLAYYGPPNEAKTYFGKTDFAEIYSALEPTDENPNIPAQAEEKFRASPDFQRYVVEPLNQGPAGRTNVQQQTVEVKPPKRGNPWKQFLFLSMRYMELLKNDTVNLLILLLQAPVIALILYFLAAHDVFNPTNVVTCPPNPQHPVPVTAPSHSKFDCQNVVNALNTPQGLQFLQQNHLTADQALQQSIAPGSGGNAQKILFIMAFAAVMFGCINGTGAIVREAPIYRRERAVNLGIAPYMFSKIVVLGLLCLLQSAVLVLVVNGTAPFQHSVFLPSILEIYITMALTSIAGLMLGLTISAVAPNNDRATSFIPIILIPQVIFSGIIFALDNPGLQFLGAFFAARWSMAGLGSTIGLHGEALGSGKDYAYRGTLFSSYTQNEAIVHLLLMWFALVVMSVAFTILIAYFLKRKDIRQ